MRPIFIRVPRLKPGLGTALSLRTMFAEHTLPRVKSFCTIHNRFDRLFALRRGASAVLDLEQRALRRRALGPHRRRLWLRHVAFERSDRLIQRIALDGLLPRPADQRHDLVVGEPHRRRRAGLVIDALEYDRALEVIAAERERDL